ncbi:glycine/betaine ABC transporter [Anaerobacillus alkalidiazotrophicus]|uniref:Glycine/betaine ABC transporter n=1 Tax=Anaerobacillus alkalidiazotrophicus TaxID=472963 RepID=A0A1S2M555_9BACI|nr:ABC transporter permease subunit [Anaerobacillus alkalidiazotrophicus]OIJ18390.1 glycine/betaine ABC transporter [Anaerobacillus alkalidiazotrophicus]OIJ19869.1 glycine/betaine ABC transporter [Anaerobacillus alkalidiazotrophicus]
MNYFHLPLEEWTNRFVNNWLIPVLGGFFDSISSIVATFISLVTDLLNFLPAELMALLLIILAWRFAGVGVAIFTLIGSLYLGSVDLWYAAMQTLAIVIVATIFSIVIGIPIGIWSAKSPVVNRIVRPILDFMQTLPSFVYLIPAILLFGLGGVPAVISTFVFATPPAVRMTTLGIKQVPTDVVEAARAFGSTYWQMLTKVQLPMAIPTIMAGINQTIMLALSMAVIASMIGAPGLGSVVLAGISRVNVGLGLTGGLGIVVLAIILDRITQGIGEKTK